MLKNNLSVGGKVENYKSHLVVKGYSQVEGIYFGEIFYVVVKLTFIRFLLDFSSSFDLEVK